MSYIRKNMWEEDKCAHKPQRDVGCRYSVGCCDGEKFLQLATFSPESRNGQVSQTIRIPEEEMLELISYMLRRGMLSRNDLQDLL